MQVQGRLPELARASYRRAAGAAGASCWGVHPLHGDQLCVSMERPEFNELVCRCLQVRRRMRVCMGVSVCMGAC